jgi:GTP cyclohydrolase II
MQKNEEQLMRNVAIKPAAIIRTPVKRKVHTGQRAAQKSRAHIVARAKLPTSFGDFQIAAIRGARAEDEAVAILHGDVATAESPLVRVHSQCLTGDVFGSQRCDCRAQLEFSLRKVAKEAAGVVLYLPQEGRGIGLMNKIRAYELQDEGLDTVEANRQLGFAADNREYDFAADALKALGLCSVRLLSNNPDKVRQLEKSGIRVVKRVACRPPTSRLSRAYLRTKRQKMGHILSGL